MGVWKVLTVWAEREWEERDDGKIAAAGMIWCETVGDRKGEALGLGFREFWRVVETLWGYRRIIITLV